MVFESLGNIVFKGKIYDSKKLRIWINNIEYNLRRKVCKGSVVGIIGSRNAKTVCVILGCIESNVTFIPIDKDIPSERMNYMLENAQAEYLLGEQDDCEYGISQNIDYISYGELFEECSDDISIVENEIYSNPAYILYTSGSTGKPKGVVIPYAGLKNFVNAIPKVIPFRKGEKVSCFTSISFDIVFLEMVLGLYQGMNLILADDNERTNPNSLINLIKKYEIDLVQMTPSMLSMIQVYNNGSMDFLKPVKYLLLGGEKLTESMLSDIHRTSNCQVFNMYGPTETTIWSSVSDLTHKDICDLGEAIDGTTFYLVDENNEPVSKNQEGELLIGGKGLAVGYVGAPELTAEKFVMLGFGSGERVYRTGDMCKYNENNELVFIGRKDSQVKIHGHRIELDEIEHCIKQCGDVKDAAVCVKNDTIVCFFLSEQDVDVIGLREKLTGFLPKYMIPAHFIKLDKFEYTVSHKLDKKRMLESYSASLESRHTALDNLNSEEHLMMQFKNLCAETIGVPEEDIDIFADIESSGLDSISFIGLIVNIEEMFGIEFDVELLNILEFASLNDVFEYAIKLQNDLKLEVVC